MNISEKIELLREQRGISLTHLNKAIGAYRGKITDVKSKKASFTEKEIFILARELSTSTDYLLGNTDDQSPAGQKESSPKIGELTEDELKLLIAYRAASEKKRASLLGLLED